ncbi:MAG: hypothetical protein QOE54_1633 [Streptosporangiaceae bacterium]|jgi:carbon monoxide dehydrogenase subunit G|nr:hypothetical protein [Streptosporangiaceae bacterium]
MELDHEFTVPVPVDRAWPVLLDLERVAPCVPGATLDTVEGDEFTGKLKVKLGAMTITYKGTAHLVVTDESARIVTIEGSAKEARGTGTAAATVQAQLHGEGEATRVTVHTKLNITGRPAQFGRGILAEVGGKLISRFAKALSEELQVPDEERRAPAAKPPAAAATPTGEPQPTTETTPTGEPQPIAEALAQSAEPQPTREALTPAGEPQTSAAELPTSGAESPAESPAHPRDVLKAPPTIPDGFSVAEQIPEQAPRQAAPSTRESTEAAAEPPATAPAVATGAGAGGQRTPVSPRPVRRSEEAVDLLEVAGPSVVKRAAPLFGGVVALLTIRYLFRRRRGRHHR